MSSPSVEGKPIDTPCASDYIREVETFFRADPILSESVNGRRILELIQGLTATANPVIADFRRNVEEIARALKGKPKLIRDLNAVLPRDFVVQCPLDVTVLEYFVLISFDGGQILSTSGPDGIGVPYPSSTQELRVVLPLKDEWESIQTICLTNYQWGCCLSQLLQRASEYEDPRIDYDFKRVISRRQVHLAKLTQILPPSLFLHNLMRSSVVYHSDWGGYADIAKATINESPVCLKILRVYSTQDDDVKKKALFREALLWSRLSHPNILPFLGAQVSERLRFVLISPWMENGNLRTFLKDNPNHDRLRACFEISSGLEYLHGLIPPIYHMDVKAVNVLVKDDFQCCLADFGLSSIAGSQRLQSKSYAGEGTMHWQAPEVVLADFESFEKMLDSAAADVYAYGCTVFEVYTGNHPFHNLKEAALIRVHMENRKPKLPDAANLNITEDLRALVCSCWDSALERPTMSNISSKLEAELASREAPRSLGLTEPSDKEYSTDTIDQVQVSERSTSAGYTLRRPESTKWEEPTTSGYSSKRSRSPSPFEGSQSQRRSVIISSPKTEVSRPALEPSEPVKISSNGFVTPPINDHVSVLPVPLLTELRMTEEPEAMKGVENLAPKLGIQTNNLLMPPETPTLMPARSHSPTRLSIDSPVFVPRAGVLKVPKAHGLSVDAAEFQPTTFLRTSITLQTSSMTRTPSSKAIMPATPTSPLVHHSSISRSSLNADAVEFTPIRNNRNRSPLLPLSDALQKMEVDTALQKQGFPSRLNPNALPFKFSAPT